MRTALRCGTLLVGESLEPLQDAVVIVEDGIISAVGPEEDVTVMETACVQDHSEEVVLPGLIDAHVHVNGWRSMDPVAWTISDDALSAARATADLQELLRTGFTTVRDMGSRIGVGLAQAVEEGAVPGPRIFTSGMGLSQTGGPEDVGTLPAEWVAERGSYDATFVDGIDECRKEVRTRIRQGVDHVKIYTSGGLLSERISRDQSPFTNKEVSAIVEEAHRAGLTVASHAQGATGVKKALRNGVDTVEHGHRLDEEAIELLRENDAVLVPTLTSLHLIVAQGECHGVSETIREKAADAQETHLQSVARAHDAGVAIALGSDLLGTELLPHGCNLTEAELLVDAGLSEREVLRAATGVAARTVSVPVGAIEEGRLADMLVVSENPLDDISALRETSAVYQGGQRPLQT